jgi:hypothetical protein
MLLPSIGSPVALVRCYIPTQPILFGIAFFGHPLATAVSGWNNSISLCRAPLSKTAVSQ